MRLPRMTTRRWMLAVAVVAAVLGLVMMWRRRDQYQQLAMAHERSARSAVLMQAQLVEEADREEKAARTAPGRRAYELADHAILARSMVGYWSRVAIYHEQLRGKYKEAMRRPWRLVSSDPPPPSDPLRP